MLKLLSLTLLFTISASVMAQKLQVDVIAEDLDHPWSIAFLPNGDKLITERSGALKMLSDASQDHRIITGVPDVYAAGQGGLMDVVLDPDFEKNQFLYLSFSTGTKWSNHLRVIRATLQDNNLVDQTIIFDVTPAKSTPHHFGGRMAFLPDGTLLITTGDGFDYREQAQKLDNLLGKVVRINSDGSIPKNNPYVTNTNALDSIYSFGHRNPQAILVSPSGKIYMHEHGPRGGDELNLIEPAKNYGWPAITYGMDYSGAYVSPFDKFPGMEQPIVYWVPSIAPAGMAYYQGEIFPEWQGDLLIASLAEKSIRRLNIEDEAVIDQEILFKDLGYRMRDVRVGPDGYIYLLTDSSSGKVMRVSPALN